MKFQRTIFIILLLNLTLQVASQYYETGQDPANLKWLQIKTERFRVIYPESWGSSGIDFTRSLEKSYSDLGSLFPSKKTRIPVIIHNHTTHSNGYVAWAPKRMEIYPTPEQNTIPLDAYRQLTLHELTHVLQMESLNKGFTKFLSVLAGQQAIGATSSLLPLWYLEGDAVFAETVLTPSGRGRSASFVKELKAIAVEKGSNYNYDKIIQGSFKNNVPDHYQSGYQMVAWSRLQDFELWNKTLELTGENPLLINPVNISLNRNSGLSKKKLYIETFDKLGALWKNEIKESGAKEYEALNPDKARNYAGYYSPVIAGTDSIIAVKVTLSEPSRIVLIRPSLQSEKVIHTPGILYPRFISCGGGRLVWVETRNDLRWENRNYSVIMLMETESGKVRRITKSSRYLAASLSPDGKRIAAIENSPGNRNSLVIINPESGEVLEKVSSPENASLQRPEWSGDGTRITLISLSEAGEGIISYGIDERLWKTHIPSGRNDIQDSFLKNDSLFFISDMNGTENIYLQKPDGNILSLTNSRFGINDFSVTGKEILFCDYSMNGNYVSRLQLDGINPMPLNNSRPSSYTAEKFNVRIDYQSDIGKREYVPERYRKWKHLFGFHSWMPFYADIDKVQNDPASIRPGATIMSQNQLSTLIATAGYEFTEDKRHMFHSEIKWQGWYPVIESGFDYGNGALIYNVKDDGSRAPAPSIIYKGYRFNNTISLPLHFSSGRFSQFIYLAGTSSYQNNYVYNNEKSTYLLGTTQITGRLYLSNYFRSALRDLAPKWSQTVDIGYSFYPLERDYLGTLFSIKGIFYFPGVFADNNIRIRLEAEKQTIPYYYHLTGRMTLPRSYENITSRNGKFFSADYLMPLLYPDLTAGSFLYLKRIRAGLFYDQAWGKGNYLGRIVNNNYIIEFHDRNETFRSFGIELISDFYVLRIPYMISAGVQSAFRSFSEAPYFRLLFNIDIYGMNIGRRRGI